jgi:hypothetical protein
MKRAEDVLVGTAAGAKALEQGSKVVKIRIVDFMAAVVGSESVVDFWIYETAKVSLLLVMDHHRQSGKCEKTYSSNTSAIARVHNSNHSIQERKLFFD